MTNQEILEKYRVTIENGVNEICRENHIEDDRLREAVLRAYQSGFLEGFKKGRTEQAREIAKRMIKKGWPLEEVCEITELSVEVVRALAAEIAAGLGGNA